MGLAAIQRAETEGSSSQASAASSWRGLDRFYDSVSVAPATSETSLSDASSARLASLLGNVESGEAELGWQVLIDGRTLKTIGLRELTLPTEAAALAIAAEFAMQGSTIVAASTPLYNLACTAIDGYLEGEFEEAVARRELRPRAEAVLVKAADAAGEATAAADEGGLRATGESWLWPLDKARDAVLEMGLEAPVGAVSAVCAATPRLAEPVLEGGMSAVYENEVRKLREMTKDYLETDTACFRVLSASAVADLTLRRRQDKAYGPFLDWFSTRYGPELTVMEGFADGEHPKDAYVAVEDFVDRGDHFLRAALSALLGATKSATITLALLHQHVSLDQALEAARVEEDYQIEENGFVDDGHDTQQVQTRVKAAAVVAMLALMPRSRPLSGSGEFAASAVAPTFPSADLESIDAMRARTRIRRLFDVADGDRRREEATAEFQELVKARGWDKLTPAELEERVLEHQLETLSQQKMHGAFGSGKS